MSENNEEFSKEKMAKQFAKLFSEIDEDSAVIAVVANGADVHQVTYGNPFILKGIVGHMTDDLNEELKKIPPHDAVLLVTDALRDFAKGLIDND